MTELRPPLDPEAQEYAGELAAILADLHQCLTENLALLERVEGPWLPVKLTGTRRHLRDVAVTVAELIEAVDLHAKGTAMAVAFPDGQVAPPILTPRQALYLAALAHRASPEAALEEVELLADYGPAGEVDCPFCGAAAGALCRTSSGWLCPEPHAKRRRPHPVEGGT